MNLREEFLALIDALNRDGVEYGVCGGIALAIHGFPRFTKDIDILQDAWNDREEFDWQGRIVKTVSAQALARRLGGSARWGRRHKTRNTPPKEEQ